MITIYEGVDGIGKTTAAIKQLEKNIGSHYIHNWASPSNTVDQNSEETKELLLVSSANDIIMDRSYIISEYVYSKVLGRESAVTDAKISSYINILNNFKVKVKLFLFSDMRALNVKPEDAHLPFDELNEMYAKVFEMHNCENLEIIWRGQYAND